MKTSLCPGCFEDKGIPPVCPYCGYDESLKRSPLVLSHHTRLYQDRYRVGRVLGKPGGFGITYLGWDERLQTKVALKEYLPRELAGRDADHRTVAAHSGEDADAFAFGLGKFLEEARTLAKLDHPNLVRVRDFFEEHGTAYLVMDYYDGLTLAEYLTRQPGGRIPEAQAIGILLPILDGLREVHAKGFLHRDIKPANIYLTAGNRPILLDFGAARQAMGDHGRSLSVILSEGYAPLEQYQRHGEQGPWTDVYGAAATIYTMLTGKTPPAATDRVTHDTMISGLRGIVLDSQLRVAMSRGLAIEPKDRVHAIDAWLELLPYSLDALGKTREVATTLANIGNDGPQLISAKNDISFPCGDLFELESVGAQLQWSKRKILTITVFLSCILLLGMGWLYITGKQGRLLTEQASSKASVKSDVQTVYEEARLTSTVPPASEEVDNQTSPPQVSSARPSEPNSHGWRVKTSAVLSDDKENIFVYISIKKCPFRPYLRLGMEGSIIHATQTKTDTKKTSVWMLDNEVAIKSVGCWKSDNKTIKARLVSKKNLRVWNEEYDISDSSWADPKELPALIEKYKPPSLTVVPNIMDGCPSFDKIKKILSRVNLKPSEILVHGPIDKDAAEIGCPYRQSPKSGSIALEGSKVVYRSWWESG